GKAVSYVAGVQGTREERITLIRSRGKCSGGLGMKRIQWTIAVILLGALAGAAGAERVVLVAGGGTKGEGAPAIEAKLVTPFGYVRDADGSAYLVEYASRVVKIDSKG